MATSERMGDGAPNESGRKVGHTPTPEEEARAIRDTTEAWQPPHPDTIRLNWLEYMARNGGIYLYNGVDVAAEKRTAVGIGLRPGLVNRSLREGIDAALPPEWFASTGAES